MTYKIKRNGKTVKVIRGNNGRFAKRKRHTKPHRAKRSLFIAVLWYLLIATGCTGVAEFMQIEEKPLTAEPIKAEDLSPTEEQGYFESADIPAGFVEGDLFDKYFKDKAEEAREVARCESGMVANKTNATDDFGIMQINAYTWAKYFGVTREQLLDEETNIRVASEIYKLAGGWYDWRFSKKCHHLN